MNDLTKSLSSFQEAIKAHNISNLSDCEQLQEFPKLLDALQKINCHDLGMKTSELETYFKQNTLTCIKVPTGSAVSIDVFCLPKGISLNMHDHPDMLVLTKVLYGAVHQRSLDLVDRSFQKNNQSAILEEDQFNSESNRLEAVLHKDITHHAEDVFYLTPEKGNIHCFVAEENVIILDISFSESLYCNYYKEVQEEPKDKEEEISHQQEEPESPDSVINNSQDSQEHNITDSDSSCADNTKKIVTLVPILPPFDVRVRMIHYQGEALSLAV